MTWSSVVFILCTITSLASAGLLARGAWRPGGRLMFWSSIAFVGMAFNNVLLYVDQVVTGPQMDLSLYPNIAALASIAVLVYALIWEAT
jgi:hypothetical protein